MIDQGRVQGRRPGVTLLIVAAVIGLGFLMGQLSNSGYGNPWFDALQKPAAMPTGWVFGLTWTILYALIGYAFALVVQERGSPAWSLAINLFLAQLLLNYSWSPVFFGAHQAKLALAVLLAMLGLSIVATAAFARVRPAAAWLMAPYLGWLSFASYLNYEIVRLNPGA